MSLNNKNLIFTFIFIACGCDSGEYESVFVENESAKTSDTENSERQGNAVCHATERMVSPSVSKDLVSCYSSTVDLDIVYPDGSFKKSNFNNYIEYNIDYNYTGNSSFATLRTESVILNTCNGDETIINYRKSLESRESGSHTEYGDVPFEYIESCDRIYIISESNIFNEYNNPVTTQSVSTALLLLKYIETDGPDYFNYGSTVSFSSEIYNLNPVDYAWTVLEIDYLGRYRNPLYINSQNASFATVSTNQPYYWQVVGYKVILNVTADDGEQYRYERFMSR